ncbi:MAG TPA: GNAT family N-acetyltransferase [Acidimicrobiales bacterium]|nr:GNAT family N-acetyltransferase [Acidimicrobiales bacterium]
MERLRAEHAPELLKFEVENREYFSRSISDRGDAYFREFESELEARLSEQGTGLCAFHVLVADDGSVLGRFNLVDIGDGSAELGYRMAERAAGQGLATSTVLEVCRRAAAELELHTLRARTTEANVASRRVLLKAGFEATGSTEIGGRPAIRFERSL